VATKADFTEAEWQELRLGVIDSGFLVSVSDPGLFDSFKEATAMARHLTAGRGDSESQLVRELAAESPHGVKPTSSAAEIEQQTLEHLRAAVSCLQSKAPDELGHYRAYVLDVAQSVGEAAHGVSAREQDELGKIREALGLR
jgi:hypothetical protein